MHARAAGRVAYALAALGLTGLSGAAPTIPSSKLPSASDVLARFTEHNTGLASYASPVHIDVRIHKLFTFRIGLNGTQYFKRPDRLALEIRSVPAQYRRMFAELGTPLTWPVDYDLRVVNASGDRAPYHLEGTPKHAGNVTRMLVDVDGDPSQPLHVEWFMRDGGTVDMRLTQDASCGYQLPKHSEADMRFGGYKIHAVMDYGPYTTNSGVADSVFTL